MKPSFDTTKPWMAAFRRGFALAAACACVCCGAAAKDVTPGADKDEEIKFAEALAQALYPDLAADIVAEGRQKWPDAEVRWSKIEVDTLLMLGKFPEVEKRVAAAKSKNPKSEVYWSMNLALASGYHAYGRTADCKKIYAAFQKEMGANPPAALRRFYINAMLMYVGMVKDDPAEAVKVYEGLYNQLKKIPAAEADEFDADLEVVSMSYAELLIKTAEDLPPGKARMERAKKALGVVKELLWRTSSYVFGPAIAMRANLELLGVSGGKEEDNVRRAKALIEDYMPQLRQMHDDLRKDDPNNDTGLLRLSALPQCRYLLAKMLWNEAEKELKKTKPNTERVFTLLFGERRQNGARGRVGGGAFNHALSVFMTYPESTWASDADDLCKQILALMKKRFNKDVNYKVTDEQRTRVRKMQFQTADKLYRATQYPEAAAAYVKVLEKFPEWPESADAMGNLAMCYIENAAAESEKIKSRSDDRFAYPIMCAEAIALQLVERLCASNGQSAMKAGDAALKIAGRLADIKERAAADEIYDKYLESCPHHPNYPSMAVALGFEACANADKLRQKLDDTPEGQERDARMEAEAKRLYERGVKCLSYVPPHALNGSDAMMRKSQALAKLGDTGGAQKTLKDMLEIYKDNRQTCLNARMQLAAMLKASGLELLKSTEETVEALAAAGSPEAAAALFPKTAAEEVAGLAESIKGKPAAEALKTIRRLGSSSIIKAIKEFTNQSKDAAAIVADKSVAADDRRTAVYSSEFSLYQIGDCWQRITDPPDRLDMYRERAAKAFGDYVAAYPKGTNAPMAYFRMNLLYSMLSGNPDPAKAKEFREKSETALRSLQKLFPTHELTRKSIPILAKTYMEMNMPDKAVEQYRKMLDSNGEYNERDYLDAGETLLSKGVYETARAAFRKARTLAEKSKETKFRDWYVPKCQFGMARAYAGTKNWSEANDTIAEFLKAEEEKKKEARAHGRPVTENALVKDALELQAELAVRAGRTEQNDELRKERFNSAAASLKKLLNRYPLLPVDAVTRNKAIAEGRNPDEMDENGIMKPLDPSKPADAKKIETAKAQLERNSRNKVLRDSISLEMAHVIVQKWNAERDMGRTEQAAKTLDNVAMAYAAFINENVPDGVLTEREEQEGLTKERKIAREIAAKRANEGEMENLEKGIATGIQYLVAAGGEKNLELAVRCGEFYMQNFPDGKALDGVKQHCERAKALRGGAENESENK